MRYFDQVLVETGAARVLVVTKSARLVRITSLDERNGLDSLIEVTALVGPMRKTSQRIRVTNTARAHGLKAFLWLLISSTLLLRLHKVALGLHFTAFILILMKI